MHRRYAILGFCVLSLFVNYSSTFAKQSAAGLKSFEGFVTVAPNKKLFVKYQPAQTEKPVLVFLNGLTHRVGSWDAFVKGFEKLGYGVLRYDPVGQGQTLAKFGPIRGVIDYRDQVTDLRDLLNSLKIKKPIELVGLSYGGALAIEFAQKFPDRISNVIAMAPFIAPIKEQDEHIRRLIQTHIHWVDWIKVTFPWLRTHDPRDPKVHDALYDFFLRQIVYSSYPAAEPIILEHPYKLEATYRMAQGIRKFLAADVINRLPADKFHLVVALQDQYLKPRDYTEFWEKIEPKIRASLLFIDGTEHKINEFIPDYASAWVKLIADGDKRIANGQTYNGSVRAANATSDTETIDMEKIWK